MNAQSILNMLGKRIDDLEAILDVTKPGSPTHSKAMSRLEEIRHLLRTLVKETDAILDHEESRPRAPEQQEEPSE